MMATREVKSYFRSQREQRRSEQYHSRTWMRIMQLQEVMRDTSTTVF